MAGDFVGVPWDKWAEMHERVSDARTLAFLTLVLIVTLAYVLFAKGVISVSDFTGGLHG